MKNYVTVPYPQGRIAPFFGGFPCRLQELYGLPVFLAGNIKASHFVFLYIVMAFNFPSISHKSNVPSFVVNRGISLFSVKDVKKIRQLGSGSFGSVVLVNLVGKKTQAVVKKIKCEDDEDQRLQRLFFKESTLLNQLEHDNIVKFLGLCISPCSLMLEYLAFDFRPFGGSSKVASLDQYLKFVDDHDLIDKFPFQSLIASNIANGLSYLHGKNIVHRDLKPANQVLVSNNHYSSLEGGDLENAFKRRPIVCKLTDFDESRSEAVQTAILCQQGTINVYRGSPVYMAPVRSLFSHAWLYCITK